MPFKLTHPQHIVLSQHHVYFCHDSNHGVRLSRNQFENLHDILYIPLSMTTYPLGGGAWFFRNQDEHRLETRNGYFIFYRKSWKKYKRHIHTCIRSLLHHGERENCEYDADNEGVEPYRSRRFTSTAWREAASRSTRNARASNMYRKKHSTVSKWNYSNPRSCFSKSSQRHVSRAKVLDSSPNDFDDDLECGDECSIDDETMPLQDSVQ